MICWDKPIELIAQVSCYKKQNENKNIRIQMVIAAGIQQFNVPIFG